MSDTSSFCAHGDAGASAALTEEFEQIRREAECCGLAFAEAPIGMALVAPDGRFLRVNDVVCELLGYSRDELERMTFREVTHPADLEADLALAEELLRGEIHRYQLDKRYLRKGGAIVEAMLSVAVVRDQDGRPLHFISHIVDVSDQRRAEREREDLTRRLQAILDQAPVGIVMVDGPSRTHVSANARAIELMGPAFVARCGGVAEASTHVCWPDGRRLSYAELPSVRALHGEVIEELELALLGDRDTPLPVLVNATPIMGEGQVEGSVVVMEDITARKELERLRAEWSSVVAHDLRAPLQSVLLSVQAIERWCDDRPKLHERIERVTQTIARLGRSVSDLVDSSRLEAGRLELARAPLDLVGVIRESAERIAVQAPDRPIELCVGAPLPELLGDADRIAQVMDNLLTNAVKYGAAETPIVVSVEPRDGAVAVSVTNAGPGIPREAIPLLFGRFFRTASAKAAGIEGLGLGLYITRELVVAHGGSISVESEPGTTTLRFTLPAPAASAPAPSASSAPSGPPSK